MVRRALCLLGLVLAVAGCGQLPRPFQPADKTGNALLEIKDGMAIAVLPVTHDAPGAPLVTAEALAAALRDRNLPASTQGRARAGRRLSGRAVVQPLSAGQEEVLLYWELSNAQGQRLAAVAQRGVAVPGAWRAGDPEVVRELMDQAAGKIAALVQDPTVEEAALTAPLAAPTPPKLVILPIEDLPGDGGRSLPWALAAELLAAGVPLAREAGADDLTIAGRVELAAPRSGRQEVTVGWTVTRARDGAELGRIDQRSQVPAGSLDGPWGATAGGIAAGAAAGILDLLDRLGPAI
ncbi:MAG: hypothetical protein OEM59_07105 [Rhodospirillales bacterium]|nr:hypothetical protein [Rhodospirillales bacterium]